jgi:hypothetical protein
MKFSAVKIKNLSRTVKGFGDMGKITVMLPELAMFVDRTVIFDLTIKEIKEKKTGNEVL